MSVVLTGNTIVLSGHCGVEEAEMLVSLIQTHPTAIVDLSESSHLHSALWQALLLMAPPVSGEPADPFAREWVVPLLKDARSSATK
jgi:hypothetical protein